MVKGALTERAAVLLHTEESLLIRGSHRENQESALCELRRQRRRNVRRRRGYNNGLERSLVRPSQSSIADVHLHVAVTQPLQTLAVIVIVGSEIEIIVVQAGTRAG